MLPFVVISISLKFENSDLIELCVILPDHLHENRDFIVMRSM